MQGFMLNILQDLLVLNIFIPAEALKIMILEEKLLTIWVKSNETVRKDNFLKILFLLCKTLSCFYIST